MSLKTRIDALVTAIAGSFNSLKAKGYGSASISSETGAVADANDAIVTGFYKIVNGVNVPDPYGVLQVVANNINFVTQLYFNIYANDSFYYRTMFNGTWYPWQRLYNDVQDHIVTELNKIYSNLGSPTLEELSLVHGEMSNQFRFIPPTTQEESTDGVTWTPSTRLSINQLADLMIGEGQGNYYDTVIIPNTVAATTGYYRLTWDYIDTYRILNSLYMNLGTSGENVIIKIEGYKSNTTWTTIATGTVNNWPGHVYCRHNELRFINTSTWGDWYSKLRITFALINSAGNDNIGLGGIEWFGSYPSNRRNVEKYDREKTVSFPFNLKASQLISRNPDGYMPLGITSKTMVTNLNAEYVGGKNLAGLHQIVFGTCATAIATVAKDVTISNYTLQTGHILFITFTNGNNAAAITLNINGTGAKAVYFGGAAVTSTGCAEASGGVLAVYYDGTNFQLFGSQRTLDYDTYDRTYWNNSITAGVAIYDYKLLMQAADGKFYPLTLETGTGTTKTVSTQEFLFDAPILWYNSTTDVAANGTTTNVYSEFYGTTLQYTANASAFTSQALIYLKGTIQANGTFKLDNTSYTSWLTQTLPTTDDGFVYIQLGYMYTTANMRLTSRHPAYWYKDGMLRPYTGKIGYASIDDRLKTSATVTSNVDLSANGIGKTTLAANTSFTYTGYQLGKFYRHIITANGFTPSFATAARHVVIGDSFGTTGTYYVGLECIDATPGAEVLLTTIMKV